MRNLFLQGSTGSTIKIVTQHSHILSRIQRVQFRYFFYAGLTPNGPIVNQQPLPLVRRKLAVSRFRTCQQASKYQKNQALQNFAHHCTASTLVTIHSRTCHTDSKYDIGAAQRQTLFTLIFLFPWGLFARMPLQMHAIHG